MLKSRLTSAPYASTIVSPRTRKPQKTKACARPGTVDVAAQGRLAAADQPPEPVQASPGDGQRDDGDQYAEDEAHAHSLDPTRQ
jgi:hypothetical protein